MNEQGSPDGTEPQGQSARPSDVGSVGEEAAKLLGALSGWAREHGDGLGDAVQQLDEHLGSASPECSWCPVCRVAHVVRSTSPEVRDHLASAAASLVQAAAGLLAGATGATGAESAAGAPGAPGAHRPARSGVEHIDLDRDDPRPDWNIDADRPDEEEDPR